MAQNKKGRRRIDQAALGSAEPDPRFGPDALERALREERGAELKVQKNAITPGTRPAPYRRLRQPQTLDHDHGACVGCLHRYAHGVWDGYSLAMSELIRRGVESWTAMLDAKQARAVNRSVRSVARSLGIDSEELAALMRHHAS